MNDDLALIIEAAHAAGALARDIRHNGLEVEHKEDNTPVTNADLAADALLTERLRSARPHYGWLSEETADARDRLDCRRIFVVDPIDGTRAFLNDRPWWSLDSATKELIALAIAVVEDGRAVAGVVFAPETGETYAAMAGQGATRNGEAIRTSTTTVLEDCRMAGDPAPPFRDFRMMAVAVPALPPSPGPTAPRLGADALFAAAIRAFPQWESVGLNLAASAAPDKPADVVVFEPAPFATAGRIQTYLDPWRGDVLKKVSFADRSPGLQARVWVRFLHTGEAFGLTGKIIATLATAASLVLVWTGFALSWRRFFMKKPPAAAVG